MLAAPALPAVAVAAALFATACGSNNTDSPSSAASQALVNDSGSLNVQVTDRTQCATETTNEGAIVDYIGDSCTSLGSSGTGIFDSFVRLQGSPTEAGYNTNGKLEFDTKTGTWTHAILVSDIPVVIYNGQPYWELFSDINESNSTPRISLNDLEVFFTSDPNLTGYDFGSNATKIYDFDGTILINDVNQGSGRGDLRYRIPLSGIDVPANCSYKNPACTTYFVLYTEWGTPGGGTFASDGGFEEWKVKQYPYVTVAKTATTTFTRTFDWTIAKSVTPATWNLFTGDSGTSRYTVAVTKGAGTDSNWGASGNIVISNPGTQDAPIASVTDAMDGTTPTVNCGVTFPYTLPAGSSLTCTYSTSLASGTSLTNTASVTLVDGPFFTGTAAVTFGTPTTLVNDTIHVTDTFAGSLGAFSASGSQSYNRTFTCNADQGSHGNTATITETSQSASASATVNCYEITTNKNASTSFTRTYAWSIAKSADQTIVGPLEVNQSFQVNYTVVVDTTSFTDSGWAAAGTITVHNPAPIAATINGVSDAISGFGAATVSCGVAFPYSLAAGGDLVCSYTANLPDASSRTNTATATRQNFSYDYLLNATATGTTDVSGTAAVTFSSTPTSEVDKCITVQDTFPVSPVTGTVCVADAPKTFGPYAEEVGGSLAATCGSSYNVDNTASFTTNDQGLTGSSTVEVTVTVAPCPTGCTLTQGYWKTHSIYGPAAYNGQKGVGDPTWNLLPNGPDTLFFLAAPQNWYQVFWTNPAGNPYYVLAHQYEAAKLNVLAGAAAPQEVSDAIAWAENFFSLNPPGTSWTKAQKKDMTYYAGILASFNEGLTGPGHCDEDSTSSPTP